MSLETSVSDRNITAVPALRALLYGSDWRRRLGRNAVSDTLLGLVVAGRRSLAGASRERLLMLIEVDRVTLVESDPVLSAAVKRFGRKQKKREARK